MNSIFMTIASALAIATLVPLWVLESRRDLMMYQQNSYRRERYLRWLRGSGDTTSPARLAAYIILLAGLSGFHLAAPMCVAMVILGAVQTYRLARARYKKPLVMTRRAIRIFAVDNILAAGVCCALTVIFGRTGIDAALYAFALSALGCYCASHIITMVSAWLLTPVEKSINRKFYNAAAARLASMPDLRIIGITGSYGKTSTKHYLHRILSEQFDTLITPGSYNTTLGVVRTINEMLKPYNQVFIVEMGAKQKGDIAEICELVHPEIGIVTAVGPQHLETFKTIDNVLSTKFELIDALPADGLAVINNDFEPIAGREVGNVAVIRYGVSTPDGCTYTASDIRYSVDGTDFAVCCGDRRIAMHTRLVGECNISNLLAAIAVAIYLGVPEDVIRLAVARIEQVEHRLSIKRVPGGLTIIDDAFNSNPSGSRMALDVLAMMTGGTRFVITPGMIELGERQYELNHRFGEHMAACADMALIVGEYNREAITEGLVAGGMAQDRIRTFASFSEAYAHVLATYRSGDTVLIENDLPDTFK